MSDTAITSEATFDRLARLRAAADAHRGISYPPMPATNRRADGQGGYHENYTGEFPWAGNVRITAFGETRERCEQVIANYLRAYPAASFDTRISEIRVRDGEFVATGRRNEERAWS